MDIDMDYSYLLNGIDVEEIHNRNERLVLSFSQLEKIRNTNAVRNNVMPYEDAVLLYKTFTSSEFQEERIFDLIEKCSSAYKNQ